MIKCINCGAENSYKSNKCHNCGHIMYQVVEAKKESTCRFCYTENPIKEMICKSCSSHMIHGQVKHETPVPEDVQKRRRMNSRLGVVLLITASVLFFIDAYSVLFDMSFSICFVTGLPLHLLIYFLPTLHLLSLSCFALGVTGVMGVLKRNDEIFAQRMIDFVFIYIALLFATFLVNTILSFGISMVGFVAILMGLPAPIIYLLGAFKIHESIRRFYH